MAISAVPPDFCADEQADAISPATAAAANSDLFMYFAPYHVLLNVHCLLSILIENRFALNKKIHIFGTHDSHSICDRRTYLFTVRSVQWSIGSLFPQEQFPLRYPLSWTYRCAFDNEPELLPHVDPREEL